MPALQQTHANPIYRSDHLFLIAGRCFRQTLNHTAAALFHPLAMRGSGSLPFLSVANPPLMPPLTNPHLGPRSKSPTSVGAVIGLSVPDIEATAGVGSGATLSLNILHRKNATSITLLPEHLLPFERTRTLAAGLSS